MPNPFLIIGHRGARALFPENTLGGIRATRALGITHIEIDVCTIKDGTPVLHHDLALNPDTLSMDGKFFSGSLPLLKDTPASDLADYQVGQLRPGSETAARFPHQTPMPGEPIPTLAQALALDPTIHFLIELKLQPDRPDWTLPPEHLVGQVLEVIDAHNAAHRVTLQSFDWRAPRHVARTRPDIPRAWLTAPETEADPQLWWNRPPTSATTPQTIAEEGGGTWTPHHDQLTQDQIEEAQTLGLQVIPWTVNTPQEMTRLTQAGANALITDNPTLYPNPTPQKTAIW